MIQVYDVLINGQVLSATAADAVETVRKGGWLNYEDDDGVQHGKVIWLHPYLRRTKVTGRDVIGWPIPLLNTDGERYHHFTLRNYAVGVILRIEAESESDAAKFVSNRQWFNSGQGFDVLTASAPAPHGGFDGLLERGLQN